MAAATLSFLAETDPAQLVLFCYSAGYFPAEEDLSEAKCLLRQLTTLWTWGLPSASLQAIHRHIWLQRPLSGGRPGILKGGKGNAKKLRNWM
jgi:hypothetical protein